MNAVSTIPIAASERDEFLAMAMQHFVELNPSFVPHEDWKQKYFETILENSSFSLRWIVWEAKRVGFILFGTEPHRFLPGTNGAIYELYIAPAFRRRGIARVCAQQAVKELWAAGPSKIQLEVVKGNAAAAALWKSLRFQEVSARFVLTSIEP